MTSPFGTPGDQQQSTFTYELPPEGEESSFYVPPGDYIARAVDFEEKTSKSGNPMWVIKFRVVAEAVKDGQKPRGVACDGKELSLFLVKTIQMAWKIRPTAAALKLIGPDNRTVSFTKQDVIGKGATITVEDSDYNGKKQSSISNVAPLPTGYVLPKPADIPF